MDQLVVINVIKLDIKDKWEYLKQYIMMQK